jgi:drug/metabolite transporter superfamily protein YnfA
MMVAVLPYPTALISHYARTPNATAAAVAYGGVMVTMALFFNAIWHYAIRAGLLTPGADERDVSGITRSYLPGPLLYLTAALLAFVSADASLVAYAAIAIFYVASASLWGRRAPV